MAENESKMAAKKDSAAAIGPRAWHPFEALRAEVDRAIEDFGRGYWLPLRHSLFAAGPLVRRQMTWWDAQR